MQDKSSAFVCLLITCSKPPVVGCCSDGRISHVASLNKVVHHVMKVGKKIAGAYKFNLLYITSISSCNSNTHASIRRVCVSGCIVVQSVQQKID